MAITQGASANAIAHPNQSRKFITTEPLSKSGEAGEQKVWDAVREAFADRECLGYWRYPIFSKVESPAKSLIF
jgi:hypothetical protein